MIEPPSPTKTAPGKNFPAAAASSGARLRRRERLRGAGRIDGLFASGRFARTRWLVARSAANGLDFSRLAAIAGRSVGGAAARNRFRRRARAAFRQLKADLPGGRDFLVLPRAGALEAPWPDWFRDFSKALRQVAVDRPDNAPPPPRDDFRRQARGRRRGARAARPQQPSSGG